MTLSIGNKRNYRVLLVEDSPANQRLIAGILQESGLEVVVAENGQVAIDLAVAAKHAGRAFDIILMDIHMPVMDGHEATRHLRKTGHTNPIIAFTSDATTENRQKCLDCGCNAFMTKPFDLSTFAAVLASHLAPDAL
jgi:CheY-like chemotaxis protein